MYCHCIGWCIGKCPLYRGVLYSECPLSEAPLYTYISSHTSYYMCIQMYMYVILAQCMCVRTNMQYVCQHQFFNNYNRGGRAL